MTFLKRTITKPKFSVFSKNFRYFRFSFKSFKSLIGYAERGFILLPSPFGEGLGVRLFHFSFFTSHSVILLPSPFGEGLGVRLSPPLGEVGRGP